MIEIYKDIPNFVGYQVSNMGNIKSYKQDKGGKILKTIVGSRGYPLINLMKGNASLPLMKIIFKFGLQQLSVD